MKQYLFAGIALASVLALGSAAQAQTTVISNFDSPVTTGPTEAPNTWYTDRFAPATFTSGVAYGGHAGTLSEAVSPADKQATTFYDTQGRKLDLPAGTTSMSIELYNDEKYEHAPDGRIAGFWGTAVDGTDALSAFPIIELDKVDGNLVLEGWDSNDPGGFTLLSQGMGAADTWDTLGISLVGSNIVYSVNGIVAGTVDSGGSVSLTNAMVQVYNSPTGTKDFAHWDNLKVGGVPEPATWAMMLIGFGGLGAVLRKRRTAALVAA